MSIYVARLLMPHYEDEDRYEQISCTLKHWPDMWPEEIAAEAAVRRERQRLRELQFFMAKDPTQRVMRHWRNYTVSDIGHHQSIISLALVPLADESGWKEIPVSDELQFFGGVSHKMYRIR